MLIQPYKTIGLFTDKPYLYYRKNIRPVIVTICNCSYKLWNIPQMTVLIHGPRFKDPILLATAAGQQVYLVLKNKILKMKNLHIVQQISFQLLHQQDYQFNVYGTQTQDFLIFGQGKTLIIYDKQDKLINKIKFNSNIQNIISIFTYINKILITLKDSFIIYNYVSGRILIQFPRQQHKFAVISPVPDIVAFVSQKQINFINIKTMQKFIDLNIKDSISCCFNTGGNPLFASINKKGILQVWSLKQMTKQCKIDLKVQGDSQIIFIDQNSGILVNNSDILLWRVGNTGLQLIKQRRGPKGNIKQLKFIDQLYAIGITDYNKGQIRQYSLMNQCYSQTYSNKIKNKNNNNTQQDFHILSQITQFSFNNQRKGEWGNLITCHLKSNFCGIWSTENKSIIKLKFQINQKQLKDRVLKSVLISRCGNFGYLGFDNGLVLKHNLQSGKLRDSFRVAYPIFGLQTDMQGNNIWVITKYIIKILDSQNKQLKYQFQFQLEGFRKSDKGNFIAIWSKNLLQIWDLKDIHKGRNYQTKNNILNVCFSPQNHHIFVLQQGCITIYDIAKDLCKQIIQFKQQFINIDISKDGTFLITTKKNSKQIYVWNNLSDRIAVLNQTIFATFQTKIIKVQTDLRKSVFENQNNIEKQVQGILNWDQTGLQIPQQNKKYLGVSTQPIQKWKLLSKYQQVTQNRKIQLKVSQNTQIPFFFDPSKTDQFSKLLAQQYLKAKKDKTNKFKQAQKKWMNPTAGLLQLQPIDIFNIIKMKSCGQIDYIIRSIIFQNSQTHSLFLQKMIILLQNNLQQIQIKLSLVQCYLRIAGQILIGNPLIKRLRQLIQIKFNDCKDRINYTKLLCSKGGSLQCLM